MSVEHQIIRLASINAASKIVELEKVHVEERKEIMEKLKNSGLVRLGKVFDLIFTETEHEKIYRETYKNF